jgi:formate--tetrahydrofolate ligase
MVYYVYKKNLNKFERGISLMTDIEIAQSAVLTDIDFIAEELGLSEDDIEAYGKKKAKIRYDAYGDKKGKLILVTAINPTPLGEGKTTMSIGLADGLAGLDKDVVLCLREPSLGPVFGIKGGAAGGGYSQVVPMEDINLHFTGDLHAIESANNLLAAMIDNHISQGNELDIARVTWRRCMDMNDRQLRKIEDGLGGKYNGVPREDGFDITVASEVMAIFCLAKDLNDLKNRLGNIIIGYNSKEEPIYCRDIQANGAMAVLLKDAFNPNLVQTLEGTPAIIHGGPFANIAHGCNSVVATKLGLSLADYVVTEAGFGADLGAEKFLDIKCRMADLAPNCIVIVATTKALKYNGGVPKDEVNEHNFKALEAGICNLQKHIRNMKSYGVPVVVVINKFNNDTRAEIDYIKAMCDVPCVVCESFAKGGEGAKEFAQTVLDAIEDNVELTRPYNVNDSIKEKVADLARQIYGANAIEYSNQALLMIDKIESLGYGNLPICVAKTQYSFSDDAKLLGAPQDFPMVVNEVRLSAGAGFIVVICGKIMTMPGLPKVPAANNITLDENNQIVGLF